MADKKEAKKIIAQNKKARHDYFVEDTYEAGIELFGTEVKSIRGGRVNLKDSFCRIDNGEMFAYGVHVSPYEQGNLFNRDPLRPKKLLMHKKEILKLFGLVGRKGYTLVPLSLYFSGSTIVATVHFIFTLPDTVLILGEKMGSLAVCEVISVPEYSSVTSLSSQVNILSTSD